MYKVLEVCRHIVNYSNSKQYPISNLRLQKLLYFIQAYFLSYTDSHTPCFEEHIEAWDFGPVVPEAYLYFKEYGSANIPSIEQYVTLIREGDKWHFKTVIFDDTIINEVDKKIINRVIDSLSDFSTLDLVKITHNQSPWKDVYKPEQKNIIISTSAIRNYFDGK